MKKAEPFDSAFSLLQRFLIQHLEQDGLILRSTQDNCNPILKSNQQTILCIHNVLHNTSKPNNNH